MEHYFLNSTSATNLIGAITTDDLLNGGCMEPQPQFDVNSSPIHTQLLINKLTDHFQNKTQGMARDLLQKTIASVIYRASISPSNSTNNVTIPSFNISESSFENHQQPQQFNYFDTQHLYVPDTSSAPSSPMSFCSSEDDEQQQQTFSFSHDLESLAIMKELQSSEQQQIQMQPQQHSETIPSAPVNPNHMTMFSSDLVVDFKHLIYNLLVENFNDSTKNFVIPINTEIMPGVYKQGFQFNADQQADKRLAEFYAQHIRKANLQLENQDSVFIQDLYKFYLRACVELLSKYFVKQDKYTYLYDDIPLFVPGGSLEDAEYRISKLGTIQRKKNSKPTTATAAKSKKHARDESPAPTKRSRSKV